MSDMVMPPITSDRNVGVWNWGGGDENNVGNVGEAKEVVLVSDALEEEVGTWIEGDENSSGNIGESEELVLGKLFVNDVGEKDSVS